MPEMKHIIVIAHNLRSTHNVGSLLRTCEGLGAKTVYLTGYTPHPKIPNDPRLPHEIEKTTKQIQKTALGAETSDLWRYEHDIFTVLSRYKKQDYTIAALEQTPDATQLQAYDVPDKLVLIVGREVEGIEPEVIAACDVTLEILMYGKKESFNVVQAAAMALYHCRFYPFSASRLR
jgi:23S rRNA (guanosine2251-2'-O)-methyltransferase